MRRLQDTYFWAFYWGFFSDCLTKILIEPYNFHNQHLVASNSNPGQNLTTDAAIVSIIQPRIGGRYWKTKVIYECKTAIHPDITRVEVKYIMELMLQAYYVKNYENISTVIACLTDMKTWHYFKLCRNYDNGSMIISFQRDIEFNLPLVPQSQVNDAQLNEELFQHVSFLVHCIKTPPHVGILVKETQQPSVSEKLSSTETHI